ncbi:DotA/TraY family protein [Gluconobacter cerinus]|uniref:DotA/TraY family protein n=1 Tax=Gluconobacter cerinus TaxID=38307 RepID=UPI0030A3DCD4
MRKILFLAALMLCIPALAHATTIATDEATCSASGSVITQTLAVPCASDWWRQSLELLFPGVGPLSSSGTSQAAQGLFAASGSFLAVLASVAVGALSWHAISGTVATAHEGVVLGQKWHTVWAPLRLCFGFGLLAPTAKGVCLAQILVVYVALYGGSLGNLVWTSYATGLVTPTLNAPPLPATGALVRDFTEAELCRRSLLANNSLTGPLFNLPASMPTATVGGTTGENISVSLGNLYNAISARFTGGNLTSSAQTNRHIVTWNYGVCGQISGTFAIGSGGDAKATEFDKTRLAAIEEARASISTGVADFLDYRTNAAGHQGDIAAGIPQISGAAFTKSISDAKSALDTEFTQAAQVLVDVQGGSDSAVASFLNDTNKYGWMTAGMFYMSTARLQSAASMLASDIPQVSLPPMADTDKSGHIDMKTWGYAGDYVKAGEAVLQPLTVQWNASADTADLRNAALAGSTQGSTASLHGVQKWLFSKIFSLGDKYLVGINPANGSPIQQLADFGNDLLNLISLVVLGGAAAGTMMGGPAGAAALAGAVASGPLSWLGIIVGMLLLVGIEHAYLIPMLPFIEFTFAAIGILITVAEAFVVLPVWAFQHIRLDGGEFVNQEQRSGYLLLLSLFLRIPLTIFGLVLSLSVMNAGVWLVSRTFSVAALSGTADSGPGPIGAVVMLVIEAWMTWKIATASLRLMTTTPELAAKMLGWTMDSLRTDGPSHFIGGVVSKTTGGVGQSAAKAGQKAGEKEGKTPEAGGTMAGQAGGDIAPTTEKPASS